MKFDKKTIADVPLDNRQVLLRADYNVPLKNGAVVDDYRMTQSLPTIRALLERGCSIVICSHLGRPKGEIKPEYSLEPVAAHLGELLGIPVGFIGDCIGDKVRQATKRLRSGQILLLENLRFHPQEEANDPAFARQLALDSGARYFVQDGFGVVHRAHASTEAITHFLPSVAGLLLEREVTILTTVMESPKMPLVAALGGAKVSDKIAIIERLIGIADRLVIGGAMANTFLQYKGQPIGKSVHEEHLQAELDRIYAKAAQRTTNVDELLLLPSDVVVAERLDEGAPARTCNIADVKSTDYILDIGPSSAANAVQALQGVGTVIWNGTMGLTEQPAYRAASAALAEAMTALHSSAMTVVGGGDTVEFVLGWNREKAAQFGHISTGGGASLELLSGKKLPGVEALLS